MGARKEVQTKRSGTQQTCANEELKDQGTDADGVATQDDNTAAVDNGDFDPEQQAAITKIQAAQRGKVARKQVEETKEAKRVETEQAAAATKIQAVHRGKATRKEMTKPLGASEPGQPGVDAAEDGGAQQVADDEASSQEAVQQKEHEEQVAAATKIQAVSRGKAARKSLEQSDVQ